MIPSLCKLAHVALDTPDIERSLWFFRDVIGMEEIERDGSRIYLRCFGELDHHSLSLREGPSAVDHIAFRTMRPEDVGAFADRFAAAGLNVTRVDDGDERGQGEAVRFVFPWLEVQTELVYEIERPQAPEAIRSRLRSNSSRMWQRGVSPRRLDHVHLHTAPEDVQAAENWAREELGFKRRECVKIGGKLRSTWMSVTPQVHDIAITADEGGRRGRFNHVAFNVESFADLGRAADIMAEHDIHIDLAPGRHGVTQGFFHYVRDPGSGHRVELFAGGYLIFDPDWEPIVWDESDVLKGLAFFGPPRSLVNDPNSSTTPCFADSGAAQTEPLTPY
jgi:catechol 2,3-dioxygenase